eukprot:TRINITY_DN9430_c0_g1_i2.p1 TRINITY_DN9430_c0_g1~~TRINITY_DN9430_c0_g1_i2.p1  ORF type:complete len:367 (-),score=53.63 TRINITY_DN9430_c0_g1_i2:10-1110(-)
MGNKGGSPVGGKKSGGGSTSPTSGTSSGGSSTSGTNGNWNPVISGPFPAGSFVPGSTIPTTNNSTYVSPPPAPIYTTPPPTSTSTANTNCKYFLNGYCRSGNTCTFKHDYSLVNTNVSCPLCGKNITGIDPNIHMDQCLGTNNNYNYNTGYNNNPYQTSTSTTSAKDLLKASVNSPFAIDCPYPGCPTKNMEARFFPYHVDKNHASAYNHKFSCPVCELMTGITYSANDQTNLLTHVRTHHQDMIKSPDQTSNNSTFPTSDYVFDYDDDIPTIPSTTSTTSSTTTSSSTTTTTSSTTGGGGGGAVGSRYIVQVLEEDMKEGECTICFEEFKKGENIARLECFCIFHEDCVVEWFKKSNNKCPLHKD